MKTLILLSVLLIVPLNAMATSYNVKTPANGGNDSNNGTSTSTPWATIGKCASTMAGGDTCTVFAGTYNENVSVSAGGVGAYKTFQVNGTDVVNVLSFSIGSHTKIIGFHITNPSSPASRVCLSVATNSTDVFITNNVITQCGTHGMVTIANYAAMASYVYVQGNTFSYACETSSTPNNACNGIDAAGDHMLFENNDFSHYLIGILHNNSFSVFRNNMFHDQVQTETPGGAGHTDAVFTEPGGGGAFPAQHNLIEGNTLRNFFGSDAKGFLQQADACGSSCFHMIIRYNNAAHIAGAIITDDRVFPNVKSYNNTWVDTLSSVIKGYTITNNFLSSASAANLNDIFYYPENLPNNNAYSTDTAPFRVGHNLGFCTNDGVNLASCNLHAHVYGAGNWTDDSGNILANPQFVNYAANDFHLQAGSPAINAGTNLTTTTNSGNSSTSLTVADSNYFQDGFGLAGVQGDCIAIGTVSNTACITAVNYTTNTLTLGSALTWNNGAPVWLYKKSDGVVVLNGSAPDIGAFPFIPSGAPPVVSISILP